MRREPTCSDCYSKKSYGDETVDVIAQSILIHVIGTTENF